MQMSRIAYVNGRYVPHREGAVHIEDRGYQFADGVYEVCEIADGCIIDLTRHLGRLERSLRELEIRYPMDPTALRLVIREVVRRNGVQNGLVYLQVTRGVAPRDHVFPSPETEPAVVITAKSVNRRAGRERAEKGVSVITLPENRWDRVDIKTVGLLPNAIARQRAKEEGAYEAWFVDADGNITEGGATNVWIITKDGVLVTRPAEHGILRGITRTDVFDIAEKLDLKIEERKFSVDEAKDALEAFVTSASSIVMPVISIDGDPVANGYPGSTSLKLRDIFYDCAEKTPV